MSDSTDALTVVRAHFDEVLMDHIHTIVDMDALPPGLILNISTIASLVVLMEREAEIDEFSESPPERYTRESFLVDIRDIGLGTDIGILSGLNPLLDSGLVTEVEDGRLKAGITAQKMMQVVNTLFPGMQGMNFVAYTVQTIDEVVSDRKDLHDAKRFFLQTLKMHSLAGQVSELSKDRMGDQKKGTFVSKAKKPASAEWNRNVLQKLSRLRSQRGAFKSEDLNIREVFGVESAKEIPEQMPEPPLSEAEINSFEAPAVAEPVEEPSAPAVPEPEEEMPPIAAVQEVVEEPPSAPAVPEPEEESPPIAAVQEVVEEPPSAPAVPEPEEESPVLSSSAVVSEPIETAAETSSLSDQEEDDEPEILGDDDIEARIAAFEDNLALTCPMCKNGKLQVNKTEKGKVFYDCSLTSCHFISWSQPFHYPCPTCANPFLVAFVTKEGNEGLKCPRATCDYSQDARMNPEEFQRKKKKKRKIVRRVKRKS
ncbi:type I DNA topoisomerase [Desulfobotulus mexicanus]|uniref:DNA topoisomerase type IA zn finger domain-containing protein n=1 Tax=Desulfobotulus mexicanus TaxID=2586642 RepID=A0A5Q4VD62_9BACT|nr:type I DNA topoisomerase [Desulfobotulus mexicanus]TYT75644.1 hypothetical protein FIM25_04185 [Desulfobotulus mexicanus]